MTSGAERPNGPGSAPQWSARALAAADRLLALGEDALLALLAAGLVVVVDIQVIYRYVLNNPLIWPEEIARLFLVWITMIGAGAVSRHDSHLRVDAAVNVLPPQARLVVLTLADAVVVLVVLVLLYYTRITMAASATMRTVAVGLPLSVMFVPFLIGGALMILHTTVGVVRRWRHAGWGHRQPASAEV